MIIWNWFIANAFSKYAENENIIIFASWVSNSQNQDDNLFDKEIKLLINTLKESKNKLFIYFSTCSIYDNFIKSSKYISHKINAEKIIKQSNNIFIIFRISNPIWYTKNKNTLINYLVNKINNNEKITIQKFAKRNLIDIEDLVKICNYIIDNWLFRNNIINIANIKNFSIFEILEWIEKTIWKKWVYKIENIWWDLNIDVSDIKEIIKDCNINFNDKYLVNLLKKYYS